MGYAPAMAGATRSDEEPILRGLSASPQAASKRATFTAMLALFWVAVCIVASPGVTARAAEPLQKLDIASAGGVTHMFQVELARKPEERERGLMFRRYLPKDRGMLFDFGSPEPATMWMENTYLPLDMVFIRADGIIARIEAHTEPMSRRVIAAGEPVLGVLELNSGVCDALGIKAGDRVIHPIFKSR
jgi:uncharacterized membrane protein (UPF0127 family)